MKNNLFTRFGLLVGFVIGALALSACGSTVDVRGSLPDQELVDSIQVGESNKERVQQLLGTPSTVALFDQEVWYYIGEKTSTVAFFDPTVLERRVVAIRFDENSRVAGISRYGLEDSKDVDIVDRETPTKGKELTFVEQLIGNIGRFNTPEDEDQ